MDVRFQGHAGHDHGSRSTRLCEFDRKQIKGEVCERCLATSPGGADGCEVPGACHGSSSTRLCEFDRKQS